MSSFGFLSFHGSSVSFSLVVLDASAIERRPLSRKPWRRFIHNFFSAAPTLQTSSRVGRRAAQFGEISSASQTRTWKHSDSTTSLFPDGTHVGSRVTRVTS